ncbi:hypothetical protein BCR34DRAFT_563617 [Clohesyomyces aquaticus]|uniref:Heterokaryon incompatibility domain-containing protein n=1 Tax=Clohesyomyces aquaticus TaxID=1231657 RepID=A0A1Y1ZRU1_9PLEO|nr:hypothetical protein BCR34DRAFT_563617 [Clohesyomyces aquaticus]
MENMEELCTAGPFSQPTHMEHVPKTIKDSMILTGILGQRYLWVDRSCIVQNDAKHKNSQIMAMTSIYAKSCYSIKTLPKALMKNGLSAGQMKEAYSTKSTSS